MSYILWTTKNMNVDDCTKSLCSHIFYKWWDKQKGFIFVITLISVTLLLIKPFSIALMFSVYALLTILITIIGYNANASMWCWFAAFAPVFTIFFYKISEKLTF